MLVVGVTESPKYYKLAAACIFLTWIYTCINLLVLRRTTYLLLRLLPECIHYIPFACQRPAIVVVASLEALPRGPGFDPSRGRISALGLKKLTRLSHVQSTVEPGLTHKATGSRVRVGQGFGGFLGLLWECHSTSQTMPWGRSPPCRSSFF